MDTLTTKRFVEKLPILKTFQDALEQDNYVSVPDDWFIGVTDVVQSRVAISKGKFKAVNMAGVAMITGVMNALDHQQIPYIFGGDGSAIAFSPGDYDLIHDVLARTRAWVSDELGLSLRAAIVPVHKIREADGDVRVAGLYVSKAITNYAFIGRGVTIAEAMMKQDQYVVDRAVENKYPNLAGLSCRWMPIQKQNSKIISMIVEAADGADQVPDAVMQQLLQMIEADKEQGRPLSTSQIKFKWPVEGIGLEAKATGTSKLKLHLIALIAQILNKTGWSMGEFDPTHYREQLALNTDYRKIQDGIRMTLSLDLAELEELKHFLERQRTAGHLRYGLSEQDQAILTCFVPSIASDDHYHFMDGAGGGYAAAADNLH